MCSRFKERTVRTLFCRSLQKLQKNPRHMILIWFCRNLSIFRNMGVSKRAVTPEIFFYIRRKHTAFSHPNFTAKSETECPFYGLAPDLEVVLGNLPSFILMQFGGVQKLCDHHGAHFGYPSPRAISPWSESGTPSPFPMISRPRKYALVAFLYFSVMSKICLRFQTHLKNLRTMQ